MSFFLRNILWVDSIGAIVTGALLLALSGWIASLYVLPTEWVMGHAAVHLAYGAYSLSLAVRKRRPMGLIKLLVFANLAWAILCAVFAARLVGGDSVFAAAHFVLEGIYVGGLAMIEWRLREELASGWPEATDTQNT